MPTRAKKMTDYSPRSAQYRLLSINADRGHEACPRSKYAQKGETRVVFFSSRVQWNLHLFPLHPSVYQSYDQTNMTRQVKIKFERGGYVCRGGIV